MVVVAATTSTTEKEPVFSEIEISALGIPAGARAVSSSSAPQAPQSSVSLIQANSTVTYLYNGQKVLAKNIPAYSWHYYYIYVPSHMKLKISYYKSGTSNRVEIYTRETYSPTQNIYDQFAYFSTYSSDLIKPSKSYGTYVYIGVRNADTYYANVYSMTVSLEASQDPCTICPSPTPSVYYRDNSDSMIPIFVLFPIVSLILIITVIVQARRINRLTQRVIALERSVNPQELQMIPLASSNMDAVPLVSANSLEQQHGSTQHEEQHHEAQQPQQTTPTAHMNYPQPVFYPVAMPNTTTTTFIPHQPFVMPPQVGNMPYPVRIYTMPPPQFQQQPPLHPQQSQSQSTQPMNEDTKQ
ncbi:hypothetical protein FDP41_008053 [Naegleria fowleri]|uniref:Uncharacterized protein n=1 Tax=Naegleria fowleri TaxID=5763 RepID=A0A6A5CFL1_NAEFO|nr:uncharacterized protein FDP41_008053 [Naegleria fowleri]KAF0984138.1 hypothetical protein FDP41_008053 [Naegleria fowleri]